MFIENSPLLLQPGGVVHLTRWVRSLLGRIPPLMPKFLGLFSNMRLTTSLASCFFMSAGAGAAFPSARFLFDILDGWKREAHLFLLKKRCKYSILGQKQPWRPVPSPQVLEGPRWC